MAGTVIHLLTAVYLYNDIKKRNGRYFFDSKLFPDKNFFIAGNICPDGVMAREGYHRHMKLHTHFRDGIPDGSFDKEGMVVLFEKRMRAFWEEHLEDEKQALGLYLGYLTHMMTDEMFILKERPKFFERIASIGLTQKDGETFVRFNHETDMVDFKMIREKPELQEAKKALEDVSEYEIKGMITKEELTKSREWILSHFFKEHHEIEDTKYLLYEDMEAFVNLVKDEVIVRLQKEKILQFLIS